MVNVVYLCDLCGNKYSREADAQSCERKGVIGPQIKVGSVFEIDNNSLDDLNPLTVLLGEKEQINHERRYELAFVARRKPNNYSPRELIGLSILIVPASYLGVKMRTLKDGDFSMLKNHIEGDELDAGVFRDALEVRSMGIEELIPLSLPNGAFALT